MQCAVLSCDGIASDASASPSRPDPKTDKTEQRDHSTNTQGLSHSSPALPRVTDVLEFSKVCDLFSSNNLDYVNWRKMNRASWKRSTAADHCGKSLVRSSAWGRGAETARGALVNGTG